MFACSSQEKGKYELITGQWKSVDDVINMYADLYRMYPGLLGYIDPLHHKVTSHICIHSNTVYW